VEVAIIDSGINPWHSHVGGIQGGLGFVMDADGRVTPHPDFRDEIGHGTAVAGIIREWAPAASLHAMKIFRQDLRAPLPVLAAALAWAVDNEVRVIHLSLGTRAAAGREALEGLCRKAHAKGLVVVAAATSTSEWIYPAVFETVIGVTWHRKCRAARWVFFPGSPIEFGACGHPRRLSGMTPEHNFSGSSFAAAHVTARVASFLETHPGADLTTIRETLIREASTDGGSS
jgi:hypothetical protein